MPAFSAVRTPALNRRHLLLGGLALMSSGTGRAESPVAGDGFSRHRPRVATLELLDRDTGRVSPVHAHQGRLFVVGRPGARYALRVHNLSPRRLLAVLSVDGVNVVSGETAAWHQTGYVLEPGARFDVTGWRKSDQAVAAFEFAALADSYAARTGRPAHVGVIGLAAFVERWDPPAAPAALAESARPAESRAAGTPPPAAPAAAPRPQAADSATTAAPPARAGKLGTGHGAHEWSAVGRTRFERASATPDQVLRLDYDSVDRLVAAGVIPLPHPVPPVGPNPFPAGAMGYVPDPPRRW